jgi:hypothetical protein
MARQIARGDLAPSDLEKWPKFILGRTPNGKAMAGLARHGTRSLS